MKYKISDDGRNLSIFDFDGTLISINSPDIFCIWCTFRYLKFIKLIKILSIKFLYSYLLRSSPNPKQKILYQLKGMSYFQLNNAAEEFSKFIQIFKIGISYNELYKQLNSSSDVIISSAGYDIYLNKIFNSNGLKTISSSLKFDHGIFTGKLKSKDNIGIEKVKNIKSYLNLDKFKKINVYSDSLSDHPIFKLGTKRHFIIKNKSKKYNLFINKIKAKKFEYRRNNILFLISKFHFKKTLLKLTPDLFFVLIYKIRHSRTIPNLIYPKTLNEKITWLKLYDRQDWHHYYADKIKVKSIIKEIVGEAYTVPTLKVFENIEDFCLNIKNLIPPYILKTNHDSSGGFIIRKKEDLDVVKLAQEFEKRIKYNHYLWTREYQYKAIKPYIFAEKLLCNGNKEIPNDYKFNMINNKLAFIYCTIDREKRNYRRIYNPNWQYKEMIWAPYGEHNSDYFNGPDIPCPKNFKLMNHLAEKLSKGFSYLRVDFYEIENKVYVGELTQHHRSGVDIIKPKRYDLELGNLLNLNLSEKYFPYENLI